MSKQRQFRGKRVDGMGWVYGLLIAPDFIRVDDSDPTQGEKPYDRYIDVWVIPETVGQCTGLQDAAGKDIYEGDVVRYEAGYKVNIATNEQIKSLSWKEGVCEFIEGCFVFKITEQHNCWFGKMPYYERSSYGKYTTITATIHD